MHFTSQVEWVRWPQFVLLWLPLLISEWLLPNSVWEESSDEITGVETCLFRTWLSLLLIFSESQWKLAREQESSHGNNQGVPETSYNLVCVYMHVCIYKIISDILIFYQQNSFNTKMGFCIIDIWFKKIGYRACLGQFGPKFHRLEAYK